LPRVHIGTLITDLNKKALIQKFLNNEANAAEAVEAQQYLQENPGLLDELLPQSEWNDLIEQPIPLDVEASIRKEVLTSTKPFRIPVHVKQWAVAASVLTAIVCLFVVNKNQTTQPSLAVTPIDVPVKQRLFDTLINTGKGQLAVVLDDGSKVQLFGHSSLVVPVSMKDNRELQLYGKAIFHVTKNPKLPFTVISGSISTTALGTVFLVDATSNQSTIQVALYEGKVVVKPIDYALDFEDTYLIPGQQCSVNREAGSMYVSSIPQFAIRTIPAPKAMQSAIEADPLTLNFVKIPLRKVFENLERRFGKSIRLDTSLIQSNLFTGSFNEEDSLLQILQVIGTMNDLQVIQESTGYTLIKTDASRTLPISTETDFIAGLLTAHSNAEMDLKPVLKTELFNKPVPVTSSITKTSDGENFRKMTLADLFDHLQQKHKIRIIYNKEQIQGLFFTGTIPDDQSYINMLQVICRMNELKLHKMKRGIYSVEPGR